MPDNNFLIFRRNFRVHLFFTEKSAVLLLPKLAVVILTIIVLWRISKNVFIFFILEERMMADVPNKNSNFFLNCTIFMNN